MPRARSVFSALALLLSLAACAGDDSVTITPKVSRAGTAEAPRPGMTYPQFRGTVSLMASAGNEQAKSMMNASHDKSSAVLQKKFMILDTNHNGRLSPEEMREF